MAIVRFSFYVPSSTTTSCSEILLPLINDHITSACALTSSHQDNPSTGSDWHSLGAAHTSYSTEIIMSSPMNAVRSAFPPNPHLIRRRSDLVLVLANGLLLTAETDQKEEECQEGNPVLFDGLRRKRNRYANTLQW